MEQLYYSFKEKEDSTLLLLKQKQSDETSAQGYAYFSQKKHEIIDNQIKLLFSQKNTNREQLRIWLQRKNTLQAFYILANTYLELGEFEEGEQILRNIPNYISLSPEELVDYYKFLDINLIIINYKKEGKTILDLSSEELSKLYDIVENFQSGSARDQAISILRVYRATMNESLFFPKGSEHIFNPFSSYINEKEIPSFKLIPNPAVDRVSVHFDELLGPDGGTITIANLQGKIVKSLFIKANQQQISISTENLLKGIYFCNYQTKDGKKFSKKLIILN